MADDTTSDASNEALTGADGSTGSADFDPMADLGGSPGAGSDSFTQTTSVSWVQKLGEAIGGVLVGLVLIIACGVALFWNEGRAVQTARSLTEGAGSVVEAPGDRVQAANEGKLVHVQGDLKTGAPLADEPFGVSIAGARLLRVVEMYQWKEESHTTTQKRVGGGEDRTTTYTYTRVWHEGRYDSGRFHVGGGHENPRPRFGNTEVVARDASLGPFKVAPAVLELLDAKETLTFGQDFAIWLGSRPGMGPVAIDGGNFYLGRSPSDPQIGDLRISYRLAPLGQVTVVGRQSGQDIQPYQTKAGDRLLMAHYGLVPAAQLFAEAQSENRILTWIIRIAAAIFLWVGFFLLLRPIAVVGDLVPVVGSLLAAGAGLASFVLMLATAPLIAGIAWLFYRPVVGIGLLIVGVAVAYGLHRLAAQRRAAGGPQPAPQAAPPLPLPSTPGAHRASAA